MGAAALLVFSLIASAAGAVQQLSLGDGNCRAVQAVSDEVIWAGCSAGRVARSVDGGKHWLQLNVPGAASLDFRGLAAFDASNAILLSAGDASEGKATLYRTSDGGRRWSIVFSSRQRGVFLDAIRFWNRKRGLVLGDPVEGKWFVLATGDGGRTWARLDSSAWPGTLKSEAAFAASNSALATAAGGNAWVGSGVGDRARVFRSRDWGRSWAVDDAPLPSNAGAGIFSLQFRGGLGLSGGGDLKKKEGSTPNLMISRDGGRRWDALPTLAPGLVESVAIVDSMRLVTGGAGGISLSADGGRSWLPATRQPVHALSCTRQSCWAVGDKGLVLKVALPPSVRPRRR